MAQLTDAEAKRLNGMCPLATELTLGDRLRTVEGGAAVTAILGTAAGQKWARGTAAVTGTLKVDTTLATVVRVVVSFEDAPSVNAMFVYAAPDAEAGHINITVLKPTDVDDCTPTASTTPTNIAWIAAGT